MKPEKLGCFFLSLLGLGGAVFVFFVFVPVMKVEKVVFRNLTKDFSTESGLSSVRFIGEWKEGAFLVRNAEPFSLYLVSQRSEPIFARVESESGAQFEGTLAGREREDGDFIFEFEGLEGLSARDSVTVILRDSKGELLWQGRFRRSISSYRSPLFFYHTSGV